MGSVRTVDLIDFYEQNLWNGIIGNQNRVQSPNMTQFIYPLPLGTGVTKPFENSNEHFPWCVVVDSNLRLRL